MSDPSTDIQLRLEQILRDYGTRLRYLLRSHKLDQHGIDPDDVEQEVRIRLWRAIERDRFGDFHASYIQRAVTSAVRVKISAPCCAASMALSSVSRASSTQQSE